MKLVHYSHSIVAFLALILILCSGPGKARAEEAAPIPPAVCAAIEGHLERIVSLAVQGVFARVTVGLQLAGIDPQAPHITLAINSAIAKAAGDSVAIVEINRNAQAILLAFGCEER